GAQDGRVAVGLDDGGPPLAGEVAPQALRPAVRTFAGELRGTRPRHREQRAVARVEPVDRRGGEHEPRDVRGPHRDAFDGLPVRVDDLPFDPAVGFEPDVAEIDDLARSWRALERPEVRRRAADAGAQHVAAARPQAFDDEPAVVARTRGGDPRLRAAARTVDAAVDEQSETVDAGDAHELAGGGRAVRQQQAAGEAAERVRPVRA